MNCLNKSSIDQLSNHHFVLFILLLLATQVIPMMANLWNAGGQVSLLSIFFPPVLIYRLFLQLEFKDAQFIYQMIEGGSPLAMISGEDILIKVCSSFNHYSIIIQSSFNHHSILFPYLLIMCRMAFSTHGQSFKVY